MADYVYNFTAFHPGRGAACESQYFPSERFGEPGTMLWGVLGALVGLYGFVTTNNGPVAYNMYHAQIAVYGFASALFHHTLHVGVYYVSSVLNSLMQAYAIVFLADCVLKADLFPSTTARVLLSSVKLTFASYPVVHVVYSMSDTNIWLAWLGFDTIWTVHVVLLAIIYYNRRFFGCFDKYPRAKSLPQTIIFCVAAAYAFEIFDVFTCNRVAALIRSRGLWHLFLCLGCYHFATLAALLDADGSGERVSVVAHRRLFTLSYDGRRRNRAQ